MTGPTWTWSGSGRALRWLGATVASLALAPISASAHLVSTGLGPYFDGISHMAVTLQDLLPVLALSLLAGLGGKGYSRKVLFVLPAAWLVGGFLGLATGWSAPLATTTVSFLILGGLVAADRPMSTRVGIGLAIVRRGMERVGGRAGVDSSEGGGSRFWLERPKSKATAWLGWRGRGRR